MTTINQYLRNISRKRMRRAGRNEIEKQIDPEIPHQLDNETMQDPWDEIEGNMEIDELERCLNCENIFQRSLMAEIEIMKFKTGKYICQGCLYNI